MGDHKWVCESLPIERWEGNDKDGWRVEVRYGSYMRLVSIPASIIASERPAGLNANDPEVQDG